MRPRYFVFLKDVLVLALTAFGGPQAHMALFFDRLVDKRRYITEEELMELNALCNILPGPNSTQTITAIGLKIGGPNLAYLTLIIWLLPAIVIMTLAGVGVAYLKQHNISIDFARFLQPMAVGFVAHAAYKISLKVVKTRTAVALMVVSALVSYFFRSPWVYPVVFFVGGAITARRYKRQQQVPNKRIHIEWSNFILWGGVLIVAAVLGAYTRDWEMPWISQAVRLFENFYRNGSMIFGGGQVLIPLMFTEFVEFKKYLTSEEFLSGIALVNALPGPVFSFTAYIGALSMREFGLGGQLLGAAVATAGIFLPGTFLIFFVYRFWDQLKQFRIVKASLEGINAVGSGLVTSAAILLYNPIENTVLNFGIVVATFALLMFTKVPPPLIIVAGLAAGLILGLFPGKFSF